MFEYISEQLRDRITLTDNIKHNDSLALNIINITTTCADSLRSGGKVLLAGNGGSAACAQHVAGELVGRFKLERNGLPAIALNSDTVIMSALANDYGFESIFSRQVLAYGKPKDVLVLYTTSGKSLNIIKAAQQGRSSGMSVIAFVGMQHALLKEICNYVIAVPSNNTAHIQEMHLTLSHVWCGLLENIIFA